MDFAWRRAATAALAVALASLALAGCNREKLRKSGLIAEPHPRHHYHPPVPLPPAPPAEPPCPPPPPPPRSACLGPERSGPCTACPCPLPAPPPCGLVGVDEYLPMVPVANTRSAMTTLVLAPSPWTTTSGDPGTPSNGRASFRWERISDERVLTDFDGNVWASDGEIQAVSLEYVSPRISFRPSNCVAPLCFHLAASVHAYTLTEAWFDGLRNWVEEDLIGSDAEVQDMHDIGGKELSLNGDDLLESTLWKAKGTLKIPLPDVPVETTRLFGSLSFGVTTPAFGGSEDAGNENVQLDATLAFGLPLSRYLRVVGGASVLFPGEASAYEDVGLEVETAVGTARLGLEWWFTPRFAAMVGFSWYGHYTRDSGLPTDEDSTFIDIGFLYRIDERWDVSLYGAENPQSEILTTPGADFSDSQTDADFTIGLGVGWSF
jgi:hypothetical protein